MTCVNCGANNLDGVGVCARCGSAIAGESAVNNVEGLKPSLESAILASENTPVSPPMPPLPGQLKAVGYLNLVVGPLLAIVNVVVVGHSITLLEERNAPEGLSTFFEINIAIFIVLGLLLVIGGVGLLLNRKWGRIWSLIAAVFCFVALLAVSVISNIMQSMLTTGAIPLRPGQTSFYFKEPAGVMAFAPLYGILVIVLLMLPDVRAWARGGASAQPASGGAGLDGSIVTPAAAPAPGRRTSPLAVASLVCSLIPFALITQIAGLTLGIVALVKIRRSDGRLGGRGFAIAGITISSLILLFIGGLVLFFVTGRGQRVGLAGSTRNFSRSAVVSLSPTVYAGDETILAGTVRNTSTGKLTGLMVVYTLTRREGSLEQKTVPVLPSELNPQEEGRFSLQFRAKDYSAAQFAMLNGDPGGTTLNYAFPRPAEDQMTKPQK